MVGASGAIFGLLAAFALFFPNTELFLLFLPFPVKAKYLVSLYILYEVYAELQRAPGDNVAHLAHIGGALIAFFWYVTGKHNETIFTKKMNSILEDFKLAFKTGNIMNQIIIINVVVFVVVGVLGVFFTLSGQAEIFNAVTGYLILPADPAQFILQPWSLITYFFLHKGFFHILWNMLFMYWFGRLITEYLGQNKLLGLYVWGGIGGGLFYLIDLQYCSLFLFCH